MLISGDGELCRCAYHPCDGPYRPKGNACPFATRWPPRLTARARSPVRSPVPLNLAGLAAGAVADDDAQALAERLPPAGCPARRDQAGGHPPGRPSLFPPRRLQRAPSALSRLLVVATSPPLVRCRRPWPASLRSASWRCSALSAMRSASTGSAIGAWTSSRRAGVCRRMVQNAIREAARLGLVTVEERRREGRRNLPNIVRIVSKEWTSWLEGRAVEPPEGRAPIGCKKLRPTDSKDKKTRRACQNRSLLPEGSRQVRQCTIAKDRPLAEKPIRAAADSLWPETHGS